MSFWHFRKHSVFTWYLLVIISCRKNKAGAITKVRNICTVLWTHFSDLKKNCAKSLFVVTVVYCKQNSCLWPLWFKVRGKILFEQRLLQFKKMFKIPVLTYSTLIDLKHIVRNIHRQWHFLLWGLWFILIWTRTKLCGQAFGSQWCAERVCSVWDVGN